MQHHLHTTTFESWNSRLFFL